MGQRRSSVAASEAGGAFCRAAALTSFSHSASSEEAATSAGPPPCNTFVRPSDDFFSTTTAATTTTPTTPPTTSSSSSRPAFRSERRSARHAGMAASSSPGASTTTAPNQSAPVPARGPVPAPAAAPLLLVYQIRPAKGKSSSSATSAPTIATCCARLLLPEAGTSSPVTIISVCEHATAIGAPWRGVGKTSYLFRAMVTVVLLVLCVIAGALPLGRSAGVHRSPHTQWIQGAVAATAVSPALQIGDEVAEASQTAPAGIDHSYVEMAETAVVGDNENIESFPFSPEAADDEVPVGIDDPYRRSGAATYEWYEPTSEIESTATLVSSTEGELPQKEVARVPWLYELSFLHDFLNYVTALLWFSAYTALLRQVQRSRNIRGLSLQSLFALVWVEVSNVLLVVCVSLFHRKSFLNAEFFLVDVSSAAISLFTFLYVSRLFGSSYEAERDNFGKQVTRFFSITPLQLNSRKYYLGVLYILSLCLAIPMFLLRRASFSSTSSFASESLFSSSPSSSSSFFSSQYPSSFMLSASARCIFYLLSFWECFNDTVLALALLPQLCMLYNKRPRRVASLLGTFVALLFFARVFAFLYWLAFPLFHNAYPAGRGIHLATEALNILLLSDFLYYYCKASISGETDIALPL